MVNTPGRGRFTEVCRVCFHCHYKRKLHRDPGDGLMISTTSLYTTIVERIFRSLVHLTSSAVSILMRERVKEQAPWSSPLLSTAQFAVHAMRHTHTSASRVISPSLPNRPPFQQSCSPTHCSRIVTTSLPGLAQAALVQSTRPRTHRAEIASSPSRK